MLQGADLVALRGPNLATHSRQHRPRGMQPGAIKHAPVDAKQEFCRILDSVMRAGVWP